MAFNGIVAIQVAEKLLVAMVVVAKRERRAVIWKNGNLNWGLS